MSEEVDFGLTYIACPYSGTPEEMAFRHRIAGEVAAVLLRSGVSVISPLTQNVPLEREYGLPPQWDFWKPHCLKMLEACDSLFIVTLPGWDHSIGVHEEYMFALDWGLRVYHVWNEARGNGFELHVKSADEGKDVIEVLFNDQD